MDRERVLQKLRLNKDSVRLEWKVRNGNYFDEYVLTCVDKPRPELEDALASLVPYVLDLLELPTSYSRGLTVKGVTLTEPDDGEGESGAVLVAQKALSGLDGKLLSLCTPHVTRELAEGRLFDALDTVEQEAMLYLDGERAQRRLFKAVADIAPKEGSGIDEVVIEGPGGESVTLTPETRRRAEALS